MNERDELGDELVPDYLTSVQDGGFYGWPYAYFGAHEDPRLKGVRPDLVKKTIVPDVPLGSHTASLGLAFYDDDEFPQKYRGGAFVGRQAHGTGRRSPAIVSRSSPSRMASPPARPRISEGIHREPVRSVWTARWGRGRRRRLAPGG